MDYEKEIYEQINDLRDSSLDSSDNEKKEMNIDSSNNIIESKKDWIFLFFSIDLVNSTKFKSMFPHDWPNILNTFYYMGISSMESIDNGWQIWKYIGDEILMYKKIEAMDDILVSINDVDRMSKHIIDDLHETYCFSKGNLDYKSSLWLAHINNFTKKDTNQLNYYPYSYSISTSKQIDDFIGPDIDEGFRLSKFSAPQTIVIDPKIIYIIWKNKNTFDIFENIKIVDIQKLKGVNFNRFTPIIWYRNDWSKNNLWSLEERTENKIINKITDSKGKLLDNNLCISNIEDYIYNMGLQYRVDLIGERILEIEKTENIPRKFGEPYDTFEVHIAVICFLRNSDKFLTLQRSEDKVVKKLKWEFGCTKLLDNNINIIDQVKKDYKEDFNIDIDILINNETNYPYVVGTYTFKKFDNTVLGVILCAEFDNCKDLSTQEHKHIRYKLLNIDDLNTIDSECKVENFDNHVKIAFNLLKDKKNNSKDNLNE